MTDELIRRKAVKLIDDAIEYVEVHGFNINKYEDSEYPDGPKCYIGTFRILAGLPAKPADGFIDPDPLAGDGEELFVAMEAIDAAAEDGVQLDLKNKLRYKLHRMFGTDIPTGRFIERLGLHFDENLGWSDEKQERYALAALKKARARLA